MLISKEKDLKEYINSKVEITLKDRDFFRIRFQPENKFRGLKICINNAIK